MQSTPPDPLPRRAIGNASRATALATLAACAVLATGCAPLPPKTIIREIHIEVPVEVPVVQPADAAARSLLAYHERLRQLPPPELQLEVAPRDDGALPPPAAVPLALALMTSHGSGELARAQSLLDQVMRDHRAPEWRPLAQLLADRLAEQRRLEDLLDKQNQQTREVQRRLDQSNQKLEALKAIERSLNAPRSGTPPTPAAGASAGGTNKP
jgi:hypothetical protein